MRRSLAFIPTLKENPAEAQVVSHRLMMRAGMIRQSTSGIYTWLPLGLKMLESVSAVVRKVMMDAGAQELLMPTIQSAELWQESGRYDSYGKEMLRMRDRHDRDMLYGPTNEELVTDVFRKHIKSYKQLPQTWFHIQWKFRDEIRPRFGVMRGREFLMKDAYSFAATEADARATYSVMFRAYLALFKALGVQAIPLRADTGAIGGDLSHEFHILADTGESVLYYDAALEEVDTASLTLETANQYYAATEELHDPATCPVAASGLSQRRGIEVGHIFYLGDKYSKALNAQVTLADGSSCPALMGCYGVGVSRLIAAIIEASHDERGIIWPAAVAPYQVILVNMRQKDATCHQVCEQLYAQLQQHGVTVLYDDRDESGGVKLAEADLLGMPQQLIIGPRSVADGKVELKNRSTGETISVAFADCVNHLIT